jgi:nucleoside-diphosphate-sugar epimerase
MRILVTGAAGKLGKAVRAELASAGHSLRLTDVIPIEHAEGEALRLDISDGVAVWRAMEGIEAVAHLAWGGKEPRDEIRRIASNHDVNAKGTFNLLWAAARQGVKRFVYTSTLSVFGTTREFGTSHFSEASEPHPAEVYGLTKLYGEQACRMIAERHRLSVVVLRLCNLADDAEWEEARVFVPDNRTGVNWRAMATHVADVARAIHLTLTVPDLRFEIIHVAADNRGRLTDIQKAKELLGFWPKRRLEP